MTRLHIRQAIGRAWHSAVFWALFSTGLRLGGFIFVLPIALRRLSTDHLGIWYAMQSLSGLVVMIELGFAPCIGRFASFYFAGAAKVPSLGVEDTPAASDAPPNLPALAGLVIMARRLYLRFALGVFVFMAGGGTLWLGYRFGPVFLHADVISAYLLFAAGMAWMMSGFYWTDLQFGVHQVRNSFRNTILSQIINYAVTILLFWAGFGLLSLAVGQLILALLPRWLARRQFLEVLPIDTVAVPQTIAVSELWPMCWRSSLVGLAGFLLLRSMTLVSAQVLDLPSTASLGLTLQLIFVVSGISQIWLSVKYPMMTGLRARRDEAGLRRLVIRRMPLCLATYALGAVVLLFVSPWAIHLMGSRTPLLSTPLFAVLLGVCGLELFMGLNAAIVLSGNRAPFLVPFLVSGIATTVLGLVLGHFFGLIGIILAPAVVQVFWNYWWTPLTCWRSMTMKAPAQMEAS